MNLKEILREIGLTQIELAESTRINPARVSLILTEKATPSVNESKKLENYFLMPIEELLERRSRCRFGT